jgi:hypothetical protein
MDAKLICQTVGVVQSVWSLLPNGPEYMTNKKEHNLIVWFAPCDQLIISHHQGVSFLSHQ